MSGLFANDKMPEDQELLKQMVEKGREAAAKMSDKGLETRMQLVWRVFACATNAVYTWKSIKSHPELDNVKCLDLLDDHIGELGQALEEAGVD